MKKLKFDFEALSQAITDSTARDAGAPEDAEETWWHPMYPFAIEKAIVQNDVALLAWLLSKSAPLHPLLLPALGYALVLRGRPKDAVDSGVKRKLTPMQEKWVRDEIRKAKREGKSQTAAIETAVDRWSVSESTIKRVLVGRISS